MSTPEQVRRFIEETRCDLIVPNVGTEHRAAEAGHAQYSAGRAREIAAAVGPNMVLHGTNCMGQADLSSIPSDGFVKVNVWTIIEKTGAEQIVEFALRNLGNLVERELAEKLVQEGLLAQQVLSPAYVRERFGGRVRPDLDHFPLVNLRDRWVRAVVSVLERYFRMFGYARLRRASDK